MRLSGTDAAEVAAAYGLGRPTGPMVPVARGELGRVWRLPVPAGAVAVKDLFMPPAEAAAAADVAFQLRAAAAGVTLPRPLPRPDGAVLSTMDSGVAVRAYEWVDLTPLDERPVAEVGRLLGVLHAAEPPAAGDRHPWFVEPVGAPGWSALLEQVRDAPFGAALGALLSTLAGLEELLPVPVRGDERRCHLDLNDSNLARDAAGRLVVLDWENSGPASPVSELAMVAGEYGPAAAPALLAGYAAAGGPARLTGPTDFGTAIAVQGHLVEFYARRWVTSDDAEDRERSLWQLRELADGLLTAARIDAVLAAAG